MKKLVLLASIALAMVVYQPVKAQISLNVNIGPRQPVYYAPQTEYAIPARNAYHYRRVVTARTMYVPVRSYRSHYARPAYRNELRQPYHHGRGHFKKNHHGRH